MGIDRNLLNCCDNFSFYTNPQTKNELLVSSIIAAGNKAATTRKREIENYIDPTLTNSATYGDYDDAKSIIANSDNLKDRHGKPRKVFETHWPNMSALQLETRSTYTNTSGSTAVELIEIINEINELI